MISPPFVIHRILFISPYLHNPNRPIHIHSTPSPQKTLFLGRLCQTLQPLTRVVPVEEFACHGPSPQCVPQAQISHRHEVYNNHRLEGEEEIVEWGCEREDNTVQSSGPKHIRVGAGGVVASDSEEEVVG